MKKFISLLPLLGALCYALPASADDTPHLRVGMDATVGVPAGATVGVEISPWENWLTIKPSLTYNALNLGGRLALKLDPMALDRKLPVGLFLEEQIGFAANGTIPGSTGGSLGYDYVNSYLGLRLGRPNKFNWNFLVGPTWMHITTGSLGSIVNTQSTGVSIGNPQANLWVLPTFETGFSITFN